MDRNYRIHLLNRDELEQIEYEKIAECPQLQGTTCQQGGRATGRACVPEPAGAQMRLGLSFARSAWLRRRLPIRIY